MKNQSLSGVNMRPQQQAFQNCGVAALPHIIVQQVFMNSLRSILGLFRPACLVADT